MLCLGSSQKKNSANELNKIETRFDERKYKMNTLKKNVKLLKGNLTI